MELSLRKFLKQDYFRAYSDESISKLALNIKKGARVILIFNDNGDYKGIINKKCLLKNFPFDTKTKISTLLHIPNKISVNSDVYDVVKLMLELEVKQAPIFDRDVFIGVVDIRDLIKNLSSKIMDGSIDRFMTTNVLYLDMHDQLKKALDIFKSRWISRVPIVEDGKVVGILTLTDALVEMLKNGEKSIKTPVNNLMQEKLVSMDKSQDIFSAINLMVSNNVSSVLVLEKGAPYGIITEKDILEQIIASQKIKKETYYIQASGELEKLTESEKKSLNDDVVNFVERYSNKFQEVCIHLYIKEISEKFREKKKFAIRINMTTDRGKFYSLEEQFGVEQALHLALKQLEVQIEKRFFKSKTPTTRNKKIKRAF